MIAISDGFIYTFLIAFSILIIFRLFCVQFTLTIRPRSKGPRRYVGWTFSAKLLSLTSGVSDVLFQFLISSCTSMTGLQVFFLIARPKLDYNFSFFFDKHLCSDLSILWSGFPTIDGFQSRPLFVSFFQISLDFLHF